MKFNVFEFDVSNRLLINTQTETEYSLTRTETQVLEQLIKHPNTVITKGQLACAGSFETVMSESAVAKAVFTIRKYLGEDYSELIETMPKKGYRLNISPPLPEWRQVKTKREKQTRIVFGWVCAFALLVGVVMHQYVWVTTPVSFIRDSHTISINNREHIEYTWLNSPQMSAEHIAHLEQRLSKALSMCESIPWKQVFFTFSSDSQVLNLVLEGVMPNGDTRVRNIKTSDFSLKPEFLSNAWLQEVSLCD
ncbi:MULTISPECIES: winged helix-turn-helix domain-containing protein [Shewanella]|uniref:winged helix-turn-helix domain-containing protein n=1 Tax=Shewanella TaxID=22 RepID=UPI001BBDC220|nr:MULTISPECIES: winged helix-turn-helix domain-containing protein [Shewanella]GIU52103.1 hypothetical protein TUM4249_20120 [Shewanella sp. KT0246]